MNTEILSPTVKGTSISIHRTDITHEDYIWDLHIHDECEFCMMISGKKIFYINNEEYVVEEGDIFFVNEKVPHKTKNFAKTSHFLMQCKNEYNNSFPDANLTCYLNKKGMNFAIFRKRSEENKLLSQCFNEIFSENKESKPHCDMFIKSCVMKVFAVLYRYNILKDSVCFFDKKSIQRIFPVLEFIENHYNETITLDHITKLMNIDKAHFCRIFKKATGTSFVQYLNFVRVHKAEKLLIETNKTISEISYDVGFSSPAYFAETFKSVMNCTPSYYKTIKTL